MTFRAGGIFSGLDTNSIIEQLVQIERIPIQKLEERQGKIDQQKAALSDIETALGDLEDAMKELGTLGSLLSYNATSSDESVVRVSATGEAAAGKHTITVQQLARAEQDRSQAFGSASDEVKAGTLTITVQGQNPVDVTIDPGDTLADVAYKINTSGARVTAAVIDTGTSAYLTLYATDTGHEIGTSPSDAVTIQENYTGTTGQELSFTETVTAQNAQFTFDGLSIERRSNTVSDVVDGLEFTLLDDTSAPSATISVEPDSDGLKENLKKFIDAYNSVATLLDAQLSYTEGQPAPALFGDGTLRNLMMRLGSVISESVSGTSTSFSTVGSVGIELTSGGLLALNEADFADAVSADFRGIAEIFLAQNTGVFDKLQSVIDDYTDIVDGLFKYKREALNDQYRNLSDQIARMEDRVDQYEKQLVAQFTYMETVIAQLQSQQGSLGGVANLLGS
ncbi:MAG: hypothetical protein D6806_07635 [Deltaproteobacteria bacterium]|nr:MAG: hypothetical protein D6806_07635 [Deltaproteobacteria bacterium]